MMMRVGMAALAAVVIMAGCAGTPEPVEVAAVAQPKVAVAGEGEARGRLDPKEVVCKKLPPTTGTRLSKGKETCQTREDWAAQEARSRSATRDMQEGGAISRDKSD
jgi:hypothetical protein